MARVFLSNETYNAATSGAQVFGAAGTEQVNIFSGTTGVSVASSVERVDLSGNIADYTFSSFGAAMTIRDSAGNIVGTVSDSGGKSVVFADGALSAAYAGTTLSLGGVALTGTAAAITPAAAAIDATITSGAAGSSSAPVAGVTQALTTTAGEVLTGGSGNDTFTATNVTYQAGDVIVGGDGTDTLNVAATAAVTAAGTVTGVENVNFNMTTFGAAATIDANNITGTGTTITVNNLQAGGSTAADLDNVSTGATVVAGTGVTGVLNVETDGTVTIQAGSATGIVLEGTAATTDSATISGVGTVTLNTNDNQQVENLTLSGNGAAVIYDLDASDAPETIAFTGSQSVTLIAAAADVGSEVATDSTTAGTTTIRIDTNTGATFDLDALAVDVIDIRGTTTGATYTVANSQAVNLGADATAVTFDAALASGAETLNLTVVATQGGATTLSDFETVNLVVNDGASTTGTITLNDLAGSNVAGSVINVSGADNLTLTGANSTFLNASAFSGVLTATLAADLLQVTGGSGNDLITAADVNFTLDGGDGTDTLTFGATTDLSNNTISFTNVELFAIAGGAGSAETLTLNSTDLSGKTLAISTDGGGDALAITMVTTPSLDLSNVAVDATIAVGINLAATAGVENTIIGTAAVDTLTNAGVGPITVDGKGGADVLTTGSGNDNVTAGEGADTIDVDAGTNTVNVSETTAAEDTIRIGSTGTDTTTITGFDFGGVASDDDIELDLSDIEGTTAPTNLVSGNGADIAAGALTLLSVTSAATDIGAAANGILTLGGDYASTDALETALETGGSLAPVFGNFDTIGDAILVVYDNGTDSYIATVTSSAVIADGATAAANTLTVANYVTLVGVSDATSLVAADFDNIVA